MSAYPLVVLLVSLAFGAAVLRQYLRRRRPYQLIWAASLAMAAGGSLAYIVFLSGGRSELAFRLYYILGALLMPTYLGMGSLMLAARSDRAKARVRWVLYALLVASAAGIVVLLTNPIDTRVLHDLNGGPGTGVYKPGPFLLFTITFNTLGVLAVVGVAAYSAWQLRARQDFGRLIRANALIAAGDLTIGAAGSLARLGAGGGFWLTMAVGWVIIFWGFLLTFNVQQRSAPVSARTRSAVPSGA